MIRCCNQCPRRYPGCHVECEEYIKQKAAQDEANAKRAKAKSETRDITSYIFSIKEQIRKGQYRK